MANEVASILLGKHIEVTFHGLTATKQYERMSGVVSLWEKVGGGRSLAKGDSPDP
jgi:hypothetical protein